jgi:hypothetical protein
MSLNLPPHIESNQSITIPAIAPKKVTEPTPTYQKAVTPTIKPFVPQASHQEYQPEPPKQHTIPPSQHFKVENTTIPYIDVQPEQKPASLEQQTPQKVVSENGNTFNLTGPNAQIHIHQGGVVTNPPIKFEPLTSILTATSLTDLADIKNQLEYALVVADAKRVTLEAQQKVDDNQ